MVTSEAVLCFIPPRSWAVRALLREGFNKSHPPTVHGQGLELTEYSDNNHGSGHGPVLDRDKQTWDKQIFSDVGTDENGKK